MVVLENGFMYKFGNIVGIICSQQKGAVFLLSFDKTFYDMLKVSSNGKPTMATPWKPGVTSIVWSTKYLQVMIQKQELGMENNATDNNEK